MQRTPIFDWGAMFCFGGSLGGAGPGHPSHGKGMMVCPKIPAYRPAISWMGKRGIWGA